MECTDSNVSYETPVYNFINKRVKTKYLLLEQKKFQNKSKNICEVYQSESFRCIMSFSYRVTFFCNVLEQTHYTSESPVQYFFMKKL